MMPPVFLVLTPGAHSLAQRLRETLPGAVIHGLRHRVEDCDQVFDDAISHLRALFVQDRPIIGVCASAILIRAVAPLLRDKGHEPPMIAIAEDGSAVVPLLGGHHGANDLAERLAQRLGIPASITTAGDRVLGFSFDDLPVGWRLSDTGQVKSVTASLLRGETVTLMVEHAAKAAANLIPSGKFRAGGDKTVRISAKSLGNADLTLHPPVLAVGVGCERGADVEELQSLVMGTLKDAAWALESVACLATIDIKGDEPAMRLLAERMKVPLRIFPAHELNKEKPRLHNPSEAVFRATGCWGVAEAASLAAAGPDAHLVQAKIKSARATCAISLAPEPIDVHTVGHGIGHLWVVGLGPGWAAGRTQEAEQALALAEDIVGYRLYLDLLGRSADGKNKHEFPLGAEIDRVRHALDLAGQGRAVALVSSGDAGIYAMASLVYEVLARESIRWRSLDVTIVPGVSALQTASARLGAPLGHDFCAISLSDLLTPWSIIEGRLRAASMGDFVTALYNPVSARRRDGLIKARDIFLENRDPQTPVGLGRSLGRADESVRVVALADLVPDIVDMMTIVLIGSTQTKMIRSADGTTQLWTPRGYEAKGMLPT